MVRVITSGTTRVQSVVASGNTTQVKKVVVGTPVRRVTSGGFSINNIGGVNTAGAVTGSLLIYNTTSDKWEASLNLQEQNINGGSY